MAAVRAPLAGAPVDSTTAPSYSTAGPARARRGMPYSLALTSKSSYPVGTERADGLSGPQDERAASRPCSTHRAGNTSKVPAWCTLSGCSWQ